MPGCSLWGITVVSLQHQLRHGETGWFQRIWAAFISFHHFFSLLDDRVLSTLVLLQQADNTCLCLIYFTSWQCPQMIYYLLSQASDWAIPVKWGDISINSYTRTPSLRSPSSCLSYQLIGGTVFAFEGRVSRVSLLEHLTLCVCVLRG